MSFVSWEVPNKREMFGDDVEAAFGKCGKQKLAGTLLRSWI